MTRQYWRSNRRLVSHPVPQPPKSKAHNKPKARPIINPWVIALTVTLATFMELLDTSIANVSLPYIAGGLGRSYDEVTWILTTYLVANAVVLPMSAWLSRVFGRKNYYMACVALFTITSFFCGIAPTLGIMLIARVLQGIGGGGLAPVEQAILVDTFPPAKRASAFALYTVAIVTAPAIGPVLGGWITDNYNWRWVFLINIPIGILSLFLTNRFVHDPESYAEERKTVRTNGKAPRRRHRHRPHRPRLRRPRSPPRPRPDRRLVRLPLHHLDVRHRRRLPHRRRLLGASRHPTPSSTSACSRSATSPSPTSSTSSSASASSRRPR